MDTVFKEVDSNTVLIQYTQEHLDTGTGYLISKAGAKHYGYGKAPVDATITRLRKFAIDHYNEGGDVMAECWDLEDWVDFIADGSDEKMLLTIMDIHEDRRQGIMNEIF